MPAKKYADHARLSQRWPRDLLEDVRAAAESKGWDTTQWLQEVARDALRRQKRREAA